MTRGGQRPKPTLLRVVQGNPGKRPVPENEPMPEGAPVKPIWLRRQRAVALWDEVLAFAFWLTVADSYKLAAWCDRQADFEIVKSRKEWTAADRREHRSLGSELGFDPTSRARMGSNAGGSQKKDPADKYFTA